MALVQAVGAVLLIANMVQVAAYTRRTEVGIMRLVGATRWYTQLPFLLEACLAALVGVVLSIVGLFACRALFLENALTSVRSEHHCESGHADVLFVAPFLVFVGVAMAGVTSYATLRLYVRTLPCPRKPTRRGPGTTEWSRPTARRGTTTPSSRPSRPGSRWWAPR